VAQIDIPQIAYNLVPAVAYAGQLADSGFTDTESAVAETALDVGIGVIVGSTGGATPSVKKPTASGDLTLFKGVTQYLAAREPVAGSALRYAAGDTVPCLTQGRIWVQIDATAGSTMTDQGPVYLVFTGGNAGKFRGDAGVGPAAVLVPNAKCKIGGTEGGIAMISINLP
jgi:hypothetical protein